MRLGTVVPRPHLEGLGNYPVGESRIDGVNRIIRLASNEHTVAPSPAVRNALIEVADRAHRYADAECREVVRILSGLHSLDPCELVCGDGSSELIYLLALCFAGPGDEIVIWRHGYLFYETVAKIVGASPIRVDSIRPVDVDALLASVTSRTKLVFIDNPNNPTGAYISSAEIRHLRENLPENVMLIIDAAYSEYVMASDYTPGHELVERYENVCVLRTCSKIYGLAGARLGWAHAAEKVVNILRSVRQPASVSAFAQAAAAVALLETRRIGDIKDQNAKLRTALFDVALRLGWAPFASEGNFLLIKFSSAVECSSVLLWLKYHGILVRPMTSYSLPDCLRITIGTPEEMSFLMEVLQFYEVGGHSCIQRR